MNPALFAGLVCPLTRTPLRFDPDRQELVSDEAGRAYPVRDGTPVLIVDEARLIETPAQGDGPLA